MTKKLDLKIKVDEKNLTNTFGKFVIQPMDRGYGITIGNALRRVLLTCIPVSYTHLTLPTNREV